MKSLFVCVLLAQCFSSGLSIFNSSKTEDASKTENNPAIWTEEGVWGPLLEDWAALRVNNREKRVMQLPPAPGAFVSTDDSSSDTKESKISPGKIVVTDPKKPPGRQVSETDLYLLAAIEKLVYRADFMEKRLRRVEEMLYFVMAGNRVDHEPCPDNFTRAGSNCYLFSSSAGREFDWKAASKQCTRVGAVLAELETAEETQDVITHIQSAQHLRGKDFWVGGLNPGLLWIWSNTARPVEAQSNKKKPAPSAIPGEGRCLRLGYDPALRSYGYRGTDCSVRFSYICEKPDTTSSNELRRLGRSRGIIDEL